RASQRCSSVAARLRPAPCADRPCDTPEAESKIARENETGDPYCAGRDEGLCAGRERRARGHHVIAHQDASTLHALRLRATDGVLQICLALCGRQLLLRWPILALEDICRKRAPDGQP